MRRLVALGALFVMGWLAATGMPARSDDALVGRWVRGDGGVYDITQSGTTFTGTVVIAWRSGSGPCVHPVGQAIWTGVAAQGGNKYTGTNHGYSWQGNDPASCTDLPQALTITLTGANSLNYCVADQGCADLTRQGGTTTTTTTTMTTTTPEATHDLEVEIVDGPKNVHLDRTGTKERVVYHIKVTNHGPHAAARTSLHVNFEKKNVVFPLDLSGDCTAHATVDEVGRHARVTCELLSIPPGAVRRVRFLVKFERKYSPLHYDEWKHARVETFDVVVLVYSSEVESPDDYPNEDRFTTHVFGLRH